MRTKLSKAGQQRLIKNRGGVSMAAGMAALNHQKQPMRAGAAPTTIAALLGRFNLKGK